MNPRPIALLAALLPFIAVNATYLVAAGNGLVEWCNPYLDSCTSISATGRKPPASYLFRATMLPSAVLLAIYWWLNHGWLQAQWRQRQAAVPPMVHWMLVAGLLASFGLIGYVTVLGERGEAWGLLRRVGVVFYFAFTYLAQFLWVVQLQRLAPARVAPATLSLAWGNCVLLLSLGVATIIAELWNETWYDTVEDAVEWLLALLLQLNFALGYVAWRQSGWRLEIAGNEHG